MGVERQISVEGQHDKLRSTQALPQLDYANPVPLHRRRWVQRWLVRAAGLAVALSACRWGPSLWWSVRVHYWQHQCLTYTAAPNQVIYEDHMSSPVVFWGDGHTSNRPTVHNHGSAVAARTVTCWDRLNLLTTGTTYATDGVVFLHSRQDGAGNERLVVVRFAMRAWNEWYFIWTVGDSRSGRSGTIIVPLSVETQSKKLRLFAGQPDPVDPTHFSFDYEVGGRRGTIDGWLAETEHGRHIQLKLRN